MILRRPPALSRLTLSRLRPSYSTRRATSSATSSLSSSSSPSRGPQSLQFTLDIKLPDLATKPDLPGPEIPSHFQPSPHTKASSIRHDVDHEAPMRPIFVVSGTSAQQSAGGPTYEQHGLAAEHTPSPMAPPPSPRTSFWAEILDDVGIASNSTIVDPFTKQHAAIPSQPQLPRDKPLNDQEKRGLRALLFIVAGLWLAGSLGKSKSTNSKLSHT